VQIIQIPEGISDPIPTIQGRPLEPGKDYICTNAFAGVLLLSRQRVVIKGEVWSLRLLLKSYSIEFDPFDPTEDWNGKDIWLSRGGGYGDLLMLTPLIRELKARWPAAWIHVACGSNYWGVFDGLGVICELLPIPYDRQTHIDALIQFEEVVEGDPKATRMHMAQLFADRAGITLTNLKPDYIVTQEEREWVQARFPRDGLPRVGMQLLASALYRTYRKMDSVMLKLSEQAQVLLFGAPGQIELAKEVPNVINLMDQEYKCSFRQSAALLATCDCCVSPDSALVHLSSALDVPCVGLYGPIPSHLRSTSSLSYSFNGSAVCAPCFFHADIADQFPIGMPCSEIKRCVALESIEVDDVVKRVLQFLQGPRSPALTATPESVPK